MSAHETIDSSPRTTSTTGDGCGAEGGDETRRLVESRDDDDDRGSGLVEMLPGVERRDALLRVDALWDPGVAARDAAQRARIAELEARVRELEDELAARGAPAPGQAGLLATMAHDLRGPLGNVMMAASALAPDPGSVADDPRSRRVRVTAERIQRSARRMARLLSDLVDLDHLERGCLQLTPSAAAPGALIDEARAAVQAHLAPADEIEVRLDDDLPRVRCDRARAIQSLVTLLDNAARASRGRGPVMIEAAVQGCEVEIAVTDAGPGVPEAEWPEVFGHDWHSAVPAYRGAGLGLAVVRALVEAQHGRAGVGAAPGGGVRFAIALPIDVAATARALRPRPR